MPREKNTKEAPINPSGMNTTMEELIFPEVRPIRAAQKTKNTAIMIFLSILQPDKYGIGCQDRGIAGKEIQTVVIHPACCFQRIVLKL